MVRNCSTCRNNDDKHGEVCGECIQLGGASGLPHYQEATPEEIATNQARVSALRGAYADVEALLSDMRSVAVVPGDKMHRPPEEVLQVMDAHTEDMVTLPRHYARFKIEPVRFVVENFGVAFLVGNIIKYVMRYDAKNGIEDLKKARRYIDMLIAFREGDPDWWKAPA